MGRGEGKKLPKTSFFFVDHLGLSGFWAGIPSKSKRHPFPMLGVGDV